MFPYIIDVALTAWLSSKIVKRYDYYDDIEKEQNKRRKILLLALLLLLWVLFYALRGSINGDSVVYRANYKNIYKNNFSLQYCLEKYRDPLYQVLTYFCSTISKGNWVFGCIVTGIFMYAPVIYTLAKNSEDFNLSCLLYILSLNAFFGFN